MGWAARTNKVAQDAKAGVIGPKLRIAHTPEPRHLRRAVGVDASLEILAAALARQQRRRPTRSMGGR